MTLIGDSSIVDKRLLHTTVITRDLTLDSLRNKTFGLCHIPRELDGIGDFLIQTLRPTGCSVKKTENYKGKDDSLLKAKENWVEILVFPYRF